MYDIIILGGGVTGLTLAYYLAKNNIKNIKLLEQESECGGLCRSFNIDGHICDIGGHFFQTKFKEVEDFVFSFYPKDKFYQIDPRISKIHIYNQDIDYPLEANIWQLPINLEIEYLISIIRNGESQGKPAPKNYEEWIRWKLGNKICDDYLIPYNQKLWGVDPSEFDIDWLNKIPRLDVEEILKDSLLKTQDIEKFPAHTKPYYPLNGGYGEVIKKLENMVKDYISTGIKVSKVRYNVKNKYWEINDKYLSKVLITTIPWPDLYMALGKPASISKEMEIVKYNKLVISLFETKTNEVPYHWRYQPSLKEQHHREFFISNFVKNSKKYGVFTETNSERFDSSTITFNGKNIFNYTTSAAYPLPLKGKAKAIKKILDYYKQYNLFGIGRWGEHMHYNQDVCMLNAINFVKKFKQDNVINKIKSI